MLTQLQFQVLDDGRGVGPVNSLQDARREIEAARREVYELKKYIAEHFGRLNNPGALNITQTAIQNSTIDDSTVGATTPSSGAFTTLSATSSGTNQLTLIGTSTLGASSGAGGVSYAYDTPTAADQRLGFYLMGSRGGSANTYNAAGITAHSEAAWTAGSSHPTYLTFATTASGSTTRTERVRIDSVGNFGIGTSTFGSSAAGVFSVANGTAPTTGPADTVQFYSSDDAAGHTIPSFYCEGTNVVATGQADSASSVRVKMRINGTVYTFLCI